MGKSKEPVWAPDEEVTRLQLIRALNFYNMNSDEKKRREWCLLWAKQHDRKDLVAKINDSPLWVFGTYAALARMELKGLVLTKQYKQDMMNWFENLGSAVVEVDEEGVPKPKRRVRNDPMMESFDNALDKAMVMNRYVDPVIELNGDTTTIKNYCERELATIEAEPEAYPKHMKKWFAFVLKLVDSKPVKVRKQRVMKPKKVDPLKMTKWVKYCIRDEKLDITSVKPQDLVGKKRAFLYDTGRRQLYKIFATDAGFMFKGTSILNLDPDKSVTRRVRKPEGLIKASWSVREYERIYNMAKGKEYKVPSVRTNTNLLIILST
jgi:hypothetical protein